MASFLQSYTFAVFPKTQTNKLQATQSILFLEKPKTPHSFSLSLSLSLSHTPLGFFLSLRLISHLASASRKENQSIQSKISSIIRIFFLLSSSSSSSSHFHIVLIIKRERERIMSCNGCRVLRKGCGEACVLRSCLHWIESPEAQGNATLFLAKFFGRSDLMSFISAVPDHQRPGSLLIKKKN